MDRALDIFNQYSVPITFFSLIFWAILRSYGTELLAFARRVVLLFFTIGSVVNYYLFAAGLTVTSQQMGLETYMKTTWIQYKGTDWFEGFVYGVTFSVTVGLNIYLWKKEMKPEKQEAKQKLVTTTTTVPTPEC